ncbi:AsmA-like C-terminal region-containing protein [Algirhabdus cladophorae]|uniref:YhdP family protein n=1 Tax=Algirhabdus cladophorae TaxID=3377108 RepID=UPI003B847243
MTTPSDPPPQTQPPAPKRARRKWLWALLMIIVGLPAVLAVAGYTMLGREMQAPDWVLVRLEDRASAMIPQGQLKMDDVRLVVEPDLSATVRLRNVGLSDGTGKVLAEVGEVSASLSRSAALRGELEVARVDLSGLLVSLLRNADGTLDVSLGDGQNALGDNASLAQILTQIDLFFARPELARLEAFVADSVSLSYTDVQSRRNWLADGGRMELSRSADAMRLRTDFAVLAGGASIATVEASFDSPDGRTGGSVGFTITDMPAADIAVQSPALSWLSVLDAPISGAMRFDLTDDGTLGPLFGKLEIGEGALAPRDAVRPIPFSSARTYFTYNPVKQQLRFDEVRVASDTVSAVASGQAYLRDVARGVPTTLLGQFQFSELSANPENLYSEPLELGPAALDMRLGLAPFRVDVGQFTLRPNGAPVVLSGDVEATDAGWNMAVDAQIGESSVAQILTAWPQTLGAKTRDWVVENVKEGTITDGTAALRLRGEASPNAALSFSFEQAKVQIIKTLPPLVDAAGYLSIIDNSLSIVAQKAVVDAPQGGRIDFSGSSFIIPKMGGKNPQVEVALNTDSTVTSVLSFLDLPPFNVMSKAKQPVNLVDGRVSGRTTLGFALQQKLTLADIDLSVAGVATGVRSDTLVKDRVLSSDRLEVAVDNEGLALTGPVMFGQVPASGTWRQPFGSGAASQGSRVTAEVALSNAFLSEFNVALPPGTIKGRATADLDLVLRPNQPASFDLRSDMRGATVSLQDLGWIKPANGRGSLRLSGQLGTPPKIDRFELDSAGLSVAGSFELNAGGTLKRAVFSNVRVGQWLNAPVTLTGRGRDVPPAIAVLGGTADLSKTEFGRGGGSGQGGPIDLRLDSLRISQGIRLTDFRGNFQTQGAFNGAFTGSVNGRGPITGALAPGRNGTAIRIQSEDAGKLLRAAGLLRNARGGQFDLTLQPTGAQGTYDGTLKVVETRIQDAPSLAQILSAVSIIGLLDQMASSGILFGEVDAKFRLTPNQVILAQSSATGPSMGISMDGIYNLVNGAMDMQGVLSPIYAVNGIGQIFTRKGEGLIGFNFNLGGTAEDPQVQVNPLSILTPGMFREIFRRAPPKLQ